MTESSDTPERVSIALGLTPLGRLHFVAPPADESGVDPKAARRIREAFTGGAGEGLLHLGLVEIGTALPASVGFFRDLARRFVARLCAVGDLAELRDRATVACPDEELARLVEEAPPMTGSEYLDAPRLGALWDELQGAFQTAIRDYPGSVQSLLQEKNPVWNLVGRVYLHLAEKKDDDEHPFAFLATYTTRVSREARLKHLPLGQALKSFAGDRAALLSLLRPVEKAAAQSAFLKELVDSGEVFEPLAWTPREAHRFLKDVPAFESAGVVVRVPDWWKANRSSRLQVRVTVGDKPPVAMGMDALLDFSVSLTLDGETISEKEWRELAAGAEGLSLVRGKWVELDRDKLREVLAHWKAAQRSVAQQGISFREGMRLLAGMPASGGAELETSESTREWSEFVAGGWLEQVLDGLRRPDALGAGDAADPGSGLAAVLRPYQETGVRWLWFLFNLGLGACLADDMGLGKTIQVLGLLMRLKRQSKKLKDHAPSLLVAPASLISNWQSEIERFAPQLKVSIAHPSVMPAKELAALPSAKWDGVDLVITTYGTLHRLPWINDVEWRLVVIDEAQAIKNPAAKQTRAVKALRCRGRVALTGTPIENRLSDLFSLFDFLNPGLLGTAKAFGGFVKRLAADGGAHYGPLRNLVRPYLLRRLKTDRRIIADLPDKTEVRAFCPLTKRQAVIYQEAVRELAATIRSADGIKRRGIILAFLLRFKQICNHPSQWLGDGGYAPDDSGKFARLSEIGEEIASRQEKALVFTQFREMTAPLAHHLQSIFGRPGLVLHGETPVKERKGLVDRFQSDEEIPFFVLSLKAGGTGLNLTAASHVIHFDRWWNPAVENQATDRAFRIGQRKNVLVHKFVCRGTIEEKIDALIEGKKGLATEVLTEGGEALLTEMADEDLIRMVSLDVHSALAGD